MVLESTVICVDNSDYMRNGDFIPTRLQAQQDAVNIVCHSKTRSNPENNVALITMAHTEVLVTLTTDAGRVLSKLHAVTPKGDISFITGVRVAHLALKHRQGRNHKLRIVVFVGSPIQDTEPELVKLAKRLKKEKVNVDVINFGEEDVNTEMLTTFINTLNGKDGTGSHLVTVPPGPILSDALISSPVIVGEDGTGAVAGLSTGGYEFGVDPNEDPELALALRVSMEEQRARQEEDTRKPTDKLDDKAMLPPVGEGSNEEALLEQAIAMSMNAEETPAVTIPQPDFNMMTEEQQIAYAMQMSLAPDAEKTEDTPVAMEVEGDDNKTTKEEDYSEVMNDPAFLQSVLESLPGVDPQSEAIRSAMGSLTQKDEKKDDKETKSDKDSKK